MGGLSEMELGRSGESQVFVNKTTAKVSKMVDAEYKHLFGGFTDVN